MVDFGEFLPHLIHHRFAAVPLSDALRATLRVVAPQGHFRTSFGRALHAISGRSPKGEGIYAACGGYTSSAPAGHLPL